jgi:DNA-binding transcriptional regulator YiaG
VTAATGRKERTWTSSRDLIPDDGVRLDQIITTDPAPGTHTVLDYLYDFGDDWEHQVSVETITAADPDSRYRAPGDHADHLPQAAPERNSGDHPGPERPEEAPPQTGRNQPMTSSWQQTRANALAAMTAEDRAVYDEAYEQAGIAMHLAEMVYRARTAAGLSQTELARRMGTRQPAIAAIENGAAPPPSNSSTASPEPWAAPSTSASTPPPDRPAPRNT